MQGFSSSQSVQAQVGAMADQQFYGVELNL